MRHRLRNWWTKVKAKWYLVPVVLAYKFIEDWGLGRATEFVETHAGWSASVLEWFVDNLPYLTWLLVPVIFVVLLVVTWDQSRPKPATGVTDEPEGKGELQPTREGRLPAIDPEERKRADWMTTAINDDVSNLPGCIMVNEPSIYWKHLEEKDDAYIEFNFDVRSSSVLLLEISKQVEGHTCFQDSELERVPEITQEASQLGRLRRNRTAKLTIRQWLSFPVKTRMKTAYGSQVEFDFRKVSISVVATLPDGSKVDTCRLPIPGFVLAQMPNHPDAPVPDTRGSQAE